MSGLAVFEPSRSPRRTSTEPFLELSQMPKRIVVCCDGTWQDGVSQVQRSSYTNILRLARTITHEDKRSKPFIPQIVFYQSGIGSDKSLYSRYVQGTTGASLGDKVEEAYAFIAQNYRPGDEIFLFGFSRGAYTARMVAMFIGEIGVLDRRDMDHFASIFLAYQKLGETNDTEEIQNLKAKLFPWTKTDSPGKIRTGTSRNSFSIKCLGVFDTVGSFGLPEELTLDSKELRTMFGFPDNTLGEHVERAYQALALNETRADFDCCKFQQTAGGQQKKQTLKQCWFTGSHSDIGGGYSDHDLADLSLTWMAAQIGDILSLDMSYLVSLFQPTAAWGKLKPHDSSMGIFSLARTVTRQFPADYNQTTKETIHASVLQQDNIDPLLSRVLTKHPKLVAPLMPLEEELRLHWPKLLRSKQLSLENSLNVTIIESKSVLFHG